MSEPSNFTWYGSAKSPGFRCSAVDLLVLTASVVATRGLWNVSEGASAFLLFLVGHFFLFCNVFRVPRWTELFWGACFLLNVSGNVLGASLDYPRIMFLQAPITLFVIGWAISRSGYHGIGWQCVQEVCQRTRRTE